MDSRPGTARSLPRPISSALLSPHDAYLILAHQRPEEELFDRQEANARFFEHIETETKLARSTPNQSEPPVAPIPDVRSSQSTPRSSQSRSRPSSIFGISKLKRSQEVVKLSKVDFRRLPYAVFQCILDQLRLLHHERLSTTCSTCSTCWMRDLAAMQLTCSAWDADTRKRLYEHIDISGADSADQLRKYRIQRGSRLRLLRRTLRERKLLASLVRILDVPNPNVPLYLPNGQPNPEYNEYRDLVASIVMLCPNLERLTGFYTVYDHKFDRLTHALSTRRNLEEHLWIIGENDEITARCEKQLPPGLIDKHQRYQFLHYHTAWSNLEFLMLCSPGRSGIIEHGIFVDVLNSLPNLKHLCVSSFDSDDFTDETLKFLPNLISLRLEECLGVTDTGLTRWSASPNASCLRTLSLIHQNFKDLTKVAKILASLGLLTKLVLIQSDISPKVPSDDIIFQPLLASSSLQELHWDIAPEKVDLENAMSILQSQELLEKSFTKTQGGPLAPNAHLALSIRHAGFPRLQTLRAPQDISPPGILQAVCRPSRDKNILLPSDKFARPKTTVVQAAIPKTNSLHAARLRAQAHIDGNIREAQEFMKVVITDHSGAPDESADNTDHSHSFASSTESNLTEADNSFASSTETPATEADSIFSPVKIKEFSLPSFIGRVMSSTSKMAQPPHFKLLPDMPGHDGNGGIVGWGDLLRFGAKSVSRGETPVKDGCTGAWNRNSAKGQGWWRHVARERRREESVVRMKHFF